MHVALLCYTACGGGKDKFRDIIIRNRQRMLIRASYIISDTIGQGQDYGLIILVQSIIQRLDSNVYRVRIRLYFNRSGTGIVFPPRCTALQAVIQGKVRRGY